MRSYKAVKLALAMIFCLITIIMFAGNVQALMPEFSLGELTEGSDSIVIGSVVSTSSDWNVDKTSICTTVVISVEEVIKGEKELERERITIVIAGGEVEGITQAVSDMPVFNQGERALLFLQDYTEVRALTPDIDLSQYTAPVFTVYGLFQGKLDIIDEKIENQSIIEVIEQVSEINSGERSSSEQGAIEEEPTLTLVGQSRYTYGGRKWFGDLPNVYYKVNTSGGPSGSLTAIQNAASSWSNAGAKFTYSYDGPHNRTGYAEYNGINEILWYNLGAGQALALATCFFYTATGEIVEADIVFNTYYSWSTTGYHHDVETVALHELGHWLSLEHSSVYDAIMWWQYKGIQRTLHADDIAGIKHIYDASGGAASPNLLASFASGTWWYSHPPNWERLSISTAHALTYADVNNDGSLNLVASFNSGTWYVGPGGNWIRLSTSTARAMSGIDDILIVSFPSGTWEYWQGNWYRISTSTAHAITFADVVDDGYWNPVFSFNSGTFYIEWFSGGGRWARLSTSTARAMTGDGPYLWVSFPSGTWLYGLGSWYRISTSAARAITYADIKGDGYLKPVVSFPSGTWYIDFSGSSSVVLTEPALSDLESLPWVRLSTSTARALQMAGGLTYLLDAELGIKSRNIAESFRLELPSNER